MMGIGPNPQSPMKEFIFLKLKINKINIKNINLILSFYSICDSLIKFIIILLKIRHI